MGVLQLQNGDIQRLAAHDHLILGVLQLPLGVLVVRLQLTLLQILKGLPQRVVLAVQRAGDVLGGESGRKTAVSHHCVGVSRLQHAPLGLGQTTEACPQVIGQLVVVDAVDDFDGLLQHQQLELALQKTLDWHSRKCSLMVLLLEAYTLELQVLPKSLHPIPMY